MEISENQTVTIDIGAEPSGEIVTNLESFMDRVQGDNSTTTPNLPDPNELSQILSSEISWDSFINKLNSAVRSTITIKEVIMESKIQLAQTIAKMKQAYRSEIAQITDRMNDLWVSKLAEVDKLYREGLIGKKLIELINSLDGWQLLMKPNSVQLCKFYTPPKPVTISISIDRNSKKEYHEPVCHIKAIYVNLLHAKITRGTIKLSTDRQHPNVDTSGLGTACVGQLEDREINLSKPGELISLLKEIETTYERIHSDSAYFTPENSTSNSGYNLQFTETKEEKSIWTT